MAFSKDINELISEDTSGLLGKHQSWERVSLQCVVEVTNGYAFSSSGFNTGKGLPLIRIRDIVSGKTETTYEGNFSDEYIVNNGDLLVGMDGDFNSSFWRSGKALLNQRVCKLTANKKFYNQDFLAYLLPAYLNAINQNTSATTVKHLSSKTVKNIPLPLPAKQEQDRIVEKLDEAFSGLDSGIKELKATQVKLTQQRQSLLKSAVEGSLTQQWREVNSHEIKETGEQLLGRILKQRKEQWRQQKLAEFAEKGKTPPKGWEDKYPEPVPPDTSELPVLPDGWVWASVMLTGKVQLGRQRAPKYHNGENMVPYLRVANVFEDRIDTTDVMSMHFSSTDEETYLLKNGDILLNEGQSLELVGRPAIYRNELERACFTNTLIRYQPYDYVLSEYAILVFKHFMHSGKFQKIAKITTNLAHLGAGRLAELEFPLPPINEQIKIINLFSMLSEKLERQLHDCNLVLKQSEAQCKNILKSAFSGQLVPQDPNDEPASILLERIKAEREALEKTTKPRTFRQPKKRVDTMDTLLAVLTAENSWIDAQEAFKKCGIVDGASTDRIEETYSELRQLEKAGRIEIKRSGDYDQLKFIK